jgi:hypothetical protein
MTMQTYPGASANNSRIWFAENLAMTNGGVISVSVEDGSPGARQTYIFNRALAKWEPVAVPPMGGFKFTPSLIGNDGDNLVFKYGTESGFFSVSVPPRPTT